MIGTGTRLATDDPFAPEDEGVSEGETFACAAL